MANRSAATDPANKVLTGRWMALGESLTVPVESFVYAGDPAEYNKKIDEQYLDADKKPIREARLVRERLKARDNQALIEVVTWMEQVRTEAGGVREPVGAWVVADMPVGRGEYVGRKTVVQLPLWSSAQTAYTIREVPGKMFTPERNDPVRNPTQPKGWLIDFTADKSVLVDFEGGKVKTKSAKSGTIDEETATELLIVRSDGTLTVRNSGNDANDTLRKELTGVWDQWLAEVHKKMSANTTGTTGNGFDRKP
jgi:hypothetical protein